MPNWACGTMSVILPTKNINRFLDYANGDADKYFYRTSFEEIDGREHNTHGLSKLTFSVECAWSAGDCLISPNKEDCISLEEVCEELKVQRLAASFEERGMMFGETISYEKDTGMSHYSYELHPDSYLKLDEDEEYIDNEENNTEAEAEDSEVAEPAVTLDDLIQGVTYEKR